jgi:hypothetical protein
MPPEPADAAPQRRAGLYIAGGALLAFLPLASWYWYLHITQPTFSFAAHLAFFDRAVFSAAPDQPWRRYTGVFECGWMLAKSYWPWLPFLAAGIVGAARKRDSRSWLLLLWAGVVFAICAAARSRVLRYMLPAYPAFAILSAGGAMQLIGERRVRHGMRVLAPVLVAGAALVALFPPVHLHALEIRPLAVAATALTMADEETALYDSGAPRFDEASQFEWYSGRHSQILLTPEELDQWIGARTARVFVMDRDTYLRRVAGRVEHDVAAQSGRLICVRLK